MLMLVRKANEDAYGFFILFFFFAAFIGVCVLHERQPATTASSC